MKQWALFSFIFFLSLFLITGCQKKEEVKPEERLQEYVEHWEAYDFKAMHEMTETVGKEAFIDRYEKIYHDIDVENLQISFDMPDPESENNEEEEIESVHYPLQVKMDTIAGPVSFDSEIEMVKTVEVIDEQETVNWLVNWNEGLIFPQIKDGGTIGIKAVQPARGQIYDRNRQGIAINESIYQMGVVPNQFTENSDSEKQQIADLLDITLEEIESQLNQAWVQPQHFVPLKVVPSLEQKDLAGAVSSIKPLTYQTIVGRVYPFGEAAAHLVGYIAPITAEKLDELDNDLYNENDLIGYRGLEELFEEQLRGEEGLVIYAQKEGQEPVTIAEKKVIHGKNLNLTIDIHVQNELYYALNGEAGTAAAINPSSGEVLGLVSSPSFDPNAFLYGLSSATWDKWNNDPDTPLLNRFASTFAPGSVFKPITSAIGLTNGSIDPAEGLEINGLTWQKEGWGNYRIRRVSESNGLVDLHDALVRSDNIYFAMQALGMGEEALVTGMKNFGIGEDFPFTYPIQTSTISANGSLENEVLLADTSYGQGEVQMSALHLASSFSAILNNGTIMKSSLLMDEEASSWKEGLISSEHASLLQNAMRDVVTSGTGQDANISSVEIAGKTGTAELKQSQTQTGGQENGWFVGYPLDGSIIISMMIEHIEEKPNGSGYVAEKVANAIENLPN
ncbi:penicillin-binding transpeptidase domain-containing protein [Gracilibacillus oryzae]|uniref:serine-type D-Ala-D-Ala carboxypeptidase n=1 Tax=Gracilibacillus oryzae TaxID=1672701 RepID=A0A7C8GQA5_9BACI|nr:penicillin-binding transpeptidase domain-containing protein [Gracilibacillus oryzae]KAB8125896.1 penicillin-binding transpeptidase domain-containing protein [Gracilibacillus oryzae]